MSPPQQRKTTTGPRQRRPAKSTGAAREKQEHGGITLPVLNATIPRPSIGLPSASGVPGRVLWLGGLGTLAVVGVLDWPVAVVIAVGTRVAEQRAKERLRNRMEEPEER